MEEFNLMQPEGNGQNSTDDFLKAFQLSATEEKAIKRLVKEFDLTPVQTEQPEGFTMDQLMSLDEPYETENVPYNEHIEKFITDIMHGKTELRKSDHKICWTLFECMSNDELSHLYEHVEMDWYLKNRVYNRLYKGRRKEKVREHNKSWDEYFEDIRERKTGMVIKAREMLYKAFPAQVWSKQRELLRFFLTEGTKTDRLWALDILQKDWALVGDTEDSELKSWHELLLQIWATHKDILAAKIIVNHLPLETVKELASELIAAIGYQRVALRLCEIPNYQIERDKLTSLEYLYTIAKLGRALPEGEARELLDDVIYDAICSYREEPYLAPIAHQTDEKGNPLLLVDNNISLAIWCLGQMKHTDLIMELYRREASMREYIAEHTSSPEKHILMLCDLAGKFTNKES